MCRRSCTRSVGRPIALVAALQATERFQFDSPSATLHLTALTIRPTTPRGGTGPNRLRRAPGSVPRRVACRVGSGAQGLRRLRTAEDTSIRGQVTVALHSSFAINARTESHACDHTRVLDKDFLLLGPMRRRRRMHRLLRKLDRLDAKSSGRQRPRELGRRLFVIVTTTALSLGFGAMLLHHQWGITITTHGFERPHALGQPPTVPAGLGPFRFEHHQPGQPDVPVTYNPCKVIHVVVNQRLAPPGAGSLLRSAIRTISTATGLKFHIDGTTTQTPLSSGTQAATNEPGRGWPPVLVAWTTPGQVPALAGPVAGLGGSETMLDPATQQLHYVTGTVSLDTSAILRMLRLPHGRQLARAIMMHELGHLVGLAHVHDVNELMNPDNVGLTHLGPGDREGLAALGRGHCFA